MSNTDTRIPEIFTPIDAQLWEFGMLFGLLAIPATFITWYLYSLETATTVMLVLGSLSVLCNQAATLVGD